MQVKINKQIREQKKKQERKKTLLRNSLVVQWLGLSALAATALGSIPGWGTRLLQATERDQTKKKEKERKFYPSLSFLTTEKRWSSSDSRLGTLLVQRSVALELKFHWENSIHSIFHGGSPPWVQILLHRSHGSPGC